MITTDMINFSGLVFDDYLVGAFELGRGANAPDITPFIGNIALPAFAGTGVVVEDGMFRIHILHDIRLGSTPTLHVHWSHNIAPGTYTPNSATVKWQVEWTAARGYRKDKFSAPVTTSVLSTASERYDHIITNDDLMPIYFPNLEPDTMLIGRIFRDPSDAEDTFGYDAHFIGLDAHYEKGQIGTAERNSPFTVAGGPS